jgi:2-dehydropantoate 2-reductase
MRVVVVGAGGVGSLLGWALAAEGGEVTLVRRGTRRPSGTERLVVVRPDGSRAETSVTMANRPADAGDVDVFLVAVKQHDLPAAIDHLAAIPGAPVVTVQNGIGAEEAVAAARPGAPLVAGSVTASVERARDGVLHWLRAGGIGLAPVEGPVTDLIGSLGATFERAGLAVRSYPAAPPMKWSKLLANLVGNATSALLDVDPGAVYRSHELFEVERSQLREALAVMHARDMPVVDLPGARIRLLAFATGLPGWLARPGLTRAVDSARGGKDPSLRGAVHRGGPTEVAWLNGAVGRAGTQLGVPTPVNSALVRLVAEAAADESRRAWFRDRPDRLLEALGR